jgi:hypothetical protein
VLSMQSESWLIYMRKSITGFTVVLALALALALSIGEDLGVSVLVRRLSPKSVNLIRIEERSLV